MKKHCHVGVQEWKKMGDESHEIPPLCKLKTYLWGGLIDTAHTTNGTQYKYSTKMVAQLSIHVHLVYGIMNNI